MIKIEHGVYTHPTIPNRYIYASVQVQAYLKDYQSLLEVKDETEAIEFTANPGEKPEIGDFISGGRLVKREGYQVNGDWSRWKGKDL